MKFIGLRGYTSLFPRNMDYVICGQAADRLLGLTIVTAKLQIYNKHYMIPDPQVQVFTDFVMSELKVVNLRDGIKCTSIEQAIVDLLKNDKICDGQVIPESIAMLIAADESGTFSIFSVEEYVKINKLEEKYNKYKEESYDFMR